MLHNKVLKSDASESKSVHCPKIGCYFAKGELISKGLFDVIVSTKKKQRNCLKRSDQKTLSITN